MAESIELPTMDPSLIPMTEHHKTKLKVNRRKIIEKLEYIEDVVDYLFAKNCITMDSAQTIMAKSTPMERADELVGLSRGPESAYLDFVGALEETQPDQDLYNALKEEDESGSRGTKITKKVPVLYGGAQSYFQQLKQFHQHKLEKISTATPKKHDIKNYVSLMMYRRQSEVAEARQGFQEYNILQTKSFSTPIQPSELFTPTQDDPKTPRAVLMVGCPGAGKTATAYHFLDCHANQELWSDQFSFCIFILLREINQFDADTKLSFKDIIFNTYGPPVRNRERVWRFLVKHQERLICILDGFDEIKQVTQPFFDVDIPTSPNILMYNLIKGNILPRSCLLITSRLHCVNQLKDDVARTVELAGLTPQDIRELAEKKLHPNTAKKLISIVIKDFTLLRLCRISHI